MDLKESLKSFVEKEIQDHWAGQYILADLLGQSYGYSLIFENQKSKNRFSPTIVPVSLLKDIFVKNLESAHRWLEKEIETAFAKEAISS
ncbi:MAG: hypothetical protein HYS08_08515 [Chlamydiae bacterium]|nr:hypothetical protein [Chlamydiota bacterium]